jgi:hypothetical protein
VRHHPLLNRRSIRDWRNSRDGPLPPQRLPTSERPNYLVIFYLQWQIIECRRLESSTDLRSAMTTAIDRLTGEGWLAEGTAKCGFVFLNRAGARRLLILTERDPFDATPQTFSPFK